MGNLTLIEDIFVPKLCRHRLRFGDPDHRLRLDKGRNILAFAPGKLAGYIRWTRNDYGTDHWQFVVVKTGKEGRITPYPGIHPGAQILFRARGKTAVKTALIWIDQLEKKCPLYLEAIPANFWRRAENARLLRQKLPMFETVKELSHV